MNPSTNIMPNLSLDQEQNNFFVAPEKNSLLEENVHYYSQIFSSEYGINPLIAASASLFTLASRLQLLKDAPTINKETLLNNLIHEVKAFSQKAQQLHYHSNIIAVAQYIFCLLLDEIILNTSWGLSYDWTEKNLCKFFYQESLNGERFFSLLNQALKDPNLHIDMLELMYLCLRLGLMGKYRNDDSTTLNKITDALYNTIKHVCGDLNKNLFIHSEAKTDSTEKAKTKKLPLVFWIGISIFITFAISLPLMHFALKSDASKLAAQAITSEMPAENS